VKQSELLIFGGVMVVVQAVQFDGNTVEEETQPGPFYHFIKRKPPDRRLPNLLEPMGQAHPLRKVG